ncbi:MAG TPA: SDR family oxidoreductase, partial [Candidatus Eremiobacteraceae bacterium]|nr:SDR family oxidoreductase [Candidatus Eremiobacteraceae bacterium]
MKILVTGGAGYIGAVLCERFLDAGHHVRVLDRLYWGRKPIERLIERIELVQADVRTFDASALDGIDGVVHLAGLSNDPTAEYNTQANWEMNATATEKLAHACRTRGIRRFTFGSSASIYDGLGDGMFDESARVEPRGAYSQSKFAAEKSLLAAAGATFGPVILRQGTVYGFSTRMRLDLVVNTFIKDALLSGKLFLHGGGWMWRPLVDIHDVAEAHLRCIEAPAGSLSGEIFNVVHDNFQIRQLA